MSQVSDQDSFHKAAKAIRSASRCVLFSGAGMSADSGIETFRSSSGGFWGGIFGKVALAYGGTPFGWNLTPSLVWSYFVSNFYEPIANARPHEGYDALVKLEKEVFSDGNFSTITMNVDGFHQASGADPDSVFEVHGSVKKFRCISCSTRLDVPDVLAVRNNPPRCECGGYCRPDVTLFTEALPQDQWTGAMNAISNLRRGDVVIIVGTSSVVYPAASLPSRARARGAVLIEVNPDEVTPLSSVVDIHLRGGAAAVLPQLVALVQDGDAGEGLRGHA